MGQKITLSIKKENQIDLNISNKNKLGLSLSNSRGVSNYPSLTNKPSINGVVVLGDKQGLDYKLQDKMKEITPQDIDEIIYL